MGTAPTNDDRRVSQQEEIDREVAASETTLRREAAWAERERQSLVHDHRLELRGRLADDREQRANRRDERADQRDRRADRRDQRADERELRADRRELRADVRDREADQRLINDEIMITGHFAREATEPGAEPGAEER